MCPVRPETAQVSPQEQPKLQDRNHYRQLLADTPSEEPKYNVFRSETQFAQPPEV